MSEQARQRDPPSAPETAVGEQAGAEAYQRSQQQARRARGGTDRPRPLDFDTNGFQVSQRGSSFATRVARLLNP